VAAELLRAEGQLETLAAGAHADVIVLDGDPLEDIGPLADPAAHMALVIPGRCRRPAALTRGPVQLPRSSSDIRGDHLRRPDRKASEDHPHIADYLWLSRSAEMFGIAPDLPALGSPPGDRRLVGSATHWWGELLGCWLGIRRLMTAQWHLVKGIYVPGSREAAGHLVDLAQAVCAAHLRAHWLGRWAAPAHAPSRAAP
jgi:hypothetical protein